MEQKTETKDAENMLAQIEKAFQTIGDQLDAAEQMLSGEVGVSVATSHADLPKEVSIASELEAYREAVDNLHETRKAIYQYEAQEKESSDMQAFEDVHRMLAMLGDMRGQSEELKRQCDYMKQTQASLQEISHNEQLMQMLEILQDRMASLGDYDAKIKAAAQTAMDQVAGLGEALDHRLTDIKRMEEAIVTASQELRQVASDMDTIVREASGESAQGIQASFSQLNQEFKDKLADMEQVVAEISHAAQESAKRTDEAMNMRTEDMAFLNGHQALVDKMHEIETVMKDVKIKKIRDDNNWGALQTNWDDIQRNPDLCEAIERLISYYNYLLKVLDKIEERERKEC